MNRSVLPSCRAGLIVVFMMMPTLVISESLPDALAKAYKNSQLLESTRALLRSQDENIPQALSAMRPKVMAQTSTAVSTSSGYLGANAVSNTQNTTLPLVLQIGADLTIYDGGDTKIAVQAARETAFAVRQSLVEAEQNVLLRAARAYLGVQRANTLLNLANNQLEFVKAQLEAAQSREQLGEITVTDVSLVEAQLAIAEGNVHSRRGELEIANKTYLFEIGNNPGVLDPVPPLPELPTSLKQAQVIATQQHPSIKRAQYTLSAARFNLKRFETVQRPRVVLGGRFRTNRDFNKLNRGAETVELSLSATTPLYQGGLTSSQLRQTAAATEKAAIDLQREAAVITHNVVVAWNRLEIAQLLIPTIQQQVNSAELALSGIREETALGIRTTIDQLQALQDVEEANTKLVSARTDRDIAVYELLQSLGLLTVNHLRLDVVMFDPEINYNAVKDGPKIRNRQKLINTIMERTAR